MQILHKSIGDLQGKHGVFSLILDQNNGTFEISPNVVEQKSFFTIRVRNKLLLDYEIRKSVHFVVRFSFCIVTMKSRVCAA